MFKKTNIIKKIENSLKPYDQKIIELDEKYYNLKEWIEKDCDLNSFLDLTTLYSSYSKILGLPNAKKRLMKANDLSEEMIKFMLIDYTKFKRSTPSDVDLEIRDYIKERDYLKLLKSAAKEKKNFFSIKRFSF